MTTREQRERRAPGPPSLPEQAVDPFPKSLSYRIIFDREYWESRDKSLDDYKDLNETVKP